MHVSCHVWIRIRGRCTPRTTRHSVKLDKHLRTPAGGGGGRPGKVSCAGSLTNPRTADRFLMSPAFDRNE
jgi:hypothetical protein